jgi:hypothetical protein
MFLATHLSIRRMIRVVLVDEDYGSTGEAQHVPRTWEWLVFYESLHFHRTY